MNLLTGATHGINLNINLIDKIPEPESLVPEGVVFKMYEALLLYLSTGRECPARHEEKQWR